MWLEPRYFCPWCKIPRYGKPRDIIVCEVCNYEVRDRSDDEKPSPVSTRPTTPPTPKRIWYSYNQIRTQLNVLIYMAPGLPMVALNAKVDVPFPPRSEGEVWVNSVRKILKTHHHIIVDWDSLIHPILDFICKKVFKNKAGHEKLEYNPFTMTPRNANTLYVIVLATHEYLPKKFAIEEHILDFLNFFRNHIMERLSAPYYVASVFELRLTSVSNELLLTQYGQIAHLLLKTMIMLKPSLHELGKLNEVISDLCRQAKSIERLFRKNLLDKMVLEADLALCLEKGGFSLASPPLRLTGGLRRLPKLK